jgi:hypothetical protein
MAARRVEGVQIERSADEILAVKTESFEAHALNQSAAVVYDLCDGTTSRAEMAAEVHRRTGLPADEEIVDLALSELVETGLVVMEGEAEAVPAVTRRSLIRRLALTSAATMMLPVIETVLVPSVASAQTPVVPTPTSVTPPPTTTPAPVPVPTPTPTPTPIPAPTLN